MKRSETFVQAFLDILVDQKIISPEQITDIRNKFASSSIAQFDEFLVDEGLAEPEQILIALGLYFHVPHFDVVGHFFESFLLHKYPKGFLLRNGVIPLVVEGDILTVVAAEPEYPGLASAMEQYASYDINYLVGIRRDIEDAVKEFYDESVTQDVVNDDSRIDHAYEISLTEIEEEENEAAPAWIEEKAQEED